MVTKLHNQSTGEERLLSRHKERLGPIMLKIKYGNLVEDWMESCRNTVDDYIIS